MNPSDSLQQKLPSWITELLNTVESMTFTADDVEYEVKDRFILPSVLHEAQWSYEKLKELDEEDDFTRELAKLVQSRWKGTKRELCEKALLLENTFYKIQAGKRQPGRDTVISLAFVLGLTVEETQRLLGYLEYGLSKHIKRDYLIMYCLEKGIPPVEVNLLLEQCGLRLLGPES
ncbi:MAG TPA: hypothetical protein PL004_05740 [Bacillota bacterium]|mgnify:CR=1 FL=1|nr:hypothetical protein [Bacillota bacterium]